MLNAWGVYVYVQPVFPILIMENLCALFGVLSLMEINFHNEAIANDFYELPHLFHDVDNHLGSSQKIVLCKISRQISVLNGTNFTTCLL